jgi:hypothetical protein
MMSRSLARITVVFIILKTSINHNEHNGHNETACAKPFFGIHPVGESEKPAMFLILVVFLVHVVVQLLFSGSLTVRLSGLQNLE